MPSRTVINLGVGNLATSAPIDYVQNILIWVLLLEAESCGEATPVFGLDRS
jgi:hypothetical protein